MKYILGAYSQLPFGSPEEDYEALLSKQLKPLLTLMYQNPSYRLLLRLGSNVFEYLEQKYPEINMLINDLSRKNQLEMLTSSYYDTFINLVPSPERFPQIEKTTTYIRKHFAKKPTGLWLYNQVFSPVIIQGMMLADLNYIVLSGYNQILNSVVATKPFYMDEMGKTTVVFPSDDRFSKEIADCAKSRDSLEKLLSSLEKITPVTGNAVSTIMLNMDQLCYTEGSSACYQMLFGKIADNCTLPTEYLKEHEITKQFYIPSGIYGRDFQAGKVCSINQLILDSDLSKKNYNLLNILRDISKDSKKNTDARKNLESLVQKAGCSSLYIPEYSINPKVRRSVSRCICEIESILASQDLLPNHADADGDKVPEEVVSTKSMICYLNTKGAVVSRLNYINALYDIVFANSDGLFSDSLRNSVTSKVIDLSSKRFEITPLDKKRQDFYAKSPAIEVEKVKLNITKRFKFRLNTLVVDVGIENFSSLPLKDYLYESDINLALSDPDKIESEISNYETNSLLIETASMPFNIQIFTSETVNVSKKDFTQKVQSISGERDCYQYTQYKIKKKFSVNAGEEIHFNIALKIDKNTRREK